MKKLNTLAIGTGAALLSLTAHAQSSSVTMYGIVDTFVQGARAENSLSRVQSGGLSGSRLGFRGTDDLGSGLYGIYTLEAGINTDDGTSGQGGALFGRQVFVGLKSDGFGQSILLRSWRHELTYKGGRRRADSVRQVRLFYQGFVLVLSSKSEQLPTEAILETPQLSARRRYKQKESARIEHLPLFPGRLDLSDRGVSQHRGSLPRSLDRHAGVRSRTPAYPRIPMNRAGHP